MRIIALAAAALVLTSTVPLQTAAQPAAPPSADGELQVVWEV